MSIRTPKRIPENFLEDSSLCHSTFRTAAAAESQHIYNFLSSIIIIPPIKIYYRLSFRHVIDTKRGKEFPKEKLLNEMKKERDENDKQ